jgi:hypothetical protein
MVEELLLLPNSPRGKVSYRSLFERAASPEADPHLPKSRARPFADGGDCRNVMGLGGSSPTRFEFRRCDGSLHVNG